MSRAAWKPPVLDPLLRNLLVPRSTKWAKRSTTRAVPALRVCYQRATRVTSARVNVRNTPRGVSVSTRKEIGSLPAKASEQKGTSQRAKIGQQSKSIRRISVHNGSREVRLERRPERVGFTLGDFAPSRKRSKLQPSTNRTKIVKAAVKATPKKLEHKN